MSKQWYKIVLQKRDPNYVEIYRNVQDRFHDVRVSVGSPIEMALFSREDTSKTESFYFSPACDHYANSLILELSATPCEQPSHTGLGLVDGDAASPNAIFGKASLHDMPSL